MISRLISVHKPLVIQCGGVELLPFDQSYSKTLFDLRNHADIRMGMHNNTPIEWRAHCQFVEQNLLDTPTQYLFIVMRAGEAQGLTLLRDFPGNDVEIGVMVKRQPRQHRVAYQASHMTAWFAFEQLGLQRVISKVPNGNHAALKFNRHCGFEPVRDTDKDYHYLAMTEDTYRNLEVHQQFRARWPITAVSTD